MATKKPSAALKPASTLVKKRSLIVPIALGVIVLVAIVLIVWISASQSSSAIVATVNGEPIYQEDIDAEYSRLPAEYQERYSKDFILNQTIDKRLLLQEAKRRGIAVSEEEVNAQLQTIIAQFGLTEENLKLILEGQNMTLDRYKLLVREELLLSMVIRDAVESRVQISEQELVEYYNTHIADFTAPSGGAVISHILVSNESEASLVLAKLQAGESFDLLAEQYSIDAASAKQGGYLGIVTVDTPFVPEFKEAALALKVQQYTRTPVQSQFGYHIIKRNVDTEPYKYVRSTIENQLKMSKQIELFQSFMADVRAKALIKFYTEQGVVTEQPVAGSLAGFAQCVSKEATLYGTAWSEFSQDQQKIFGTAFGYLSYVDCDEKPHICSAADIQKYPTWVIGAERFGRLSLQELAEKTGCELPN